MEIEFFYLVVVVFTIDCVPVNKFVYHSLLRLQQLPVSNQRFRQLLLESLEFAQPLILVSAAWLEALLSQQLYQFLCPSLLNWNLFFCFGKGFISLA